MQRRNVSKCQQVYGINEDYFDVIDSEDKAYFLGLLFADGCNIRCGGKHIVRIRLQEKDKYILDRFKVIMLLRLESMYKYFE